MRVNLDSRAGFDEPGLDAAEMEMDYMDCMDCMDRMDKRLEGHFWPSTL